MAIEAIIEDRPLSALGTSRENGQILAEANSSTSESSRPLEVTRLAERIEDLERQHRVLKRDALLVAGVATIATALALSVLLQKRFEPASDMQGIVSRRAISAQQFLLTDAQGHARARLTLEP